MTGPDVPEAKSSRPKIAIVGAGISGLVLAHRLQELFKESGRCVSLSVYDSKKIAGGAIETEVHDGYILEKGPDAFITDKPWALEFSKRIGLESELIPTEAANRHSLIAKQNRLMRVPDGFYLVSPVNPWTFLASSIVSWPGKLRMMAEPFIPGRKDSFDETIGDFVRRRFGREALDRIAQAMIGGIYAGDPDRLSLKATMPKFYDLERKYGSVTRGLVMKKQAMDVSKTSGPRYSLFMSLNGGMQSLTDAIAKRLDPGVLRLGQTLREVQRRTDDDPWKLRFEGGSLEEADVLCVSSSGKHARSLLGRVQPELAASLSEIHYESVATINLAYRRQDIAHPLDAFGFVVPKIENKTVMACSFSSRKFAHRAPQDCVLLRVFVGGAFGRHYLEKDNRELVGDVGRELKTWLGIRGEALFYRVQRYQEAMVQYETGHMDLVSDIQLRASEVPGLHLVGSSYAGVGIPDCIRGAESEAEKIFSTYSGGVVSYD